MKNYISISGKTTELTDDQVQELGFQVDRPDTISELIEAVRSGNARERYKVRDTVTVGSIELEIIGFDHDKDMDDPNKPTITLMGKTLLPARRMHGGACKGGWRDSELRSWLNAEYYNQLPEELAAHIRKTQKVTHTSNGDRTMTSDKLFIPSESEMFGSAIYCNYEEGPRYEAFATSEDRVRVDEDGYTDWYWTRSCACGISTSFCRVNNYGAAGYDYASYTTIRAPLCFLIS